MTGLPFSEAAERNKTPILAQLHDALGASARHVLEVGAGTGQHAEHFARALPDVVWLPADRDDYLPGLHARVAQAGLANLQTPVEVDVDHVAALPEADAIYSANTLHIMTWAQGRRLLALAGRALRPGGRLVVYGPFHVGAQPTSDSNASFDEALRARGTGMGIRSREAVCYEADANGLSLQRAVAMPANNQLLVFERRAHFLVSEQGDHRV